MGLFSSIGKITGIGKLVNDVKKIQISKPLSILKPIADIAQGAAIVGSAGIGGALGAAASKATGLLGSLKLGGTLGQVFGENGLINAIGASGASQLMNGSVTSNALLSMLLGTGGTSATEAQQEFIKMALQGGMTADEVAQNKQFRDLIINQRNTDLQSAQAGLDAFKTAANEMSAAGRKLDNVQIDSTGVTKILDQNQMLQNQQLANAQSIVTPSNTDTQKSAAETQQAASTSAAGTIKSGWGAVQGILSSYGGREVSQGVGGTSLGQAPKIEFGMSKASGVKIGDQTDAARQTLERQILEAKASGASPAQVAALRQRGELAIQQEAARVNAANEQAGAKAYYDAVSGMTNINQSASSIASAQAAQDAMIQQLDTAKKQALNDMYNQMITQGLNQADIALRLEQASSALEVQKQQAIANIQSNIGSMNITQYQTALQSAMTGLTQLGVNIGHQLGATSGALNAAGQMVAGLNESEQARNRAILSGQQEAPTTQAQAGFGGLGQIGRGGYTPGVSGTENIGSDWTDKLKTFDLSPLIYKDTVAQNGGVAPMTIGASNNGDPYKLKYKPSKTLGGGVA